MTPAVNKAACKARRLPRLLVVDDEPGVLELVKDVVSRSGGYRLLTAQTLEQAERLMAAERIDLLVADLHLPDGSGMTLVPKLHEKHPSASTLIITGNPSVNGAISAFRAGVVDFLPKPFTADHLLDRIASATRRQADVARNHTRLIRLKGAVKKLNTTRHTISKKVDLLCNDLVSAYGELSRQFDAVRMQEAFRRLLGGAADLEQLLCHAMDWILRHAGYCNVAVWLASEEHEFELGAYMKYTIAGDQPLTDAMSRGLVPLVNREGTIHLFGQESQDQLTPAELAHLSGQEIVGTNCTYLGESLAAVIMFRDEKSPFTDEDVAMIRAISPIFAVALANIVRRGQDPDGPMDDMLPDDDSSADSNPGGPFLDDHPSDDHREPRREKKSDADWWKRGEPPPF